MTLRDRALAAVDRARKIPANLGLRPYTVTIRVEQYAGAMGYGMAKTGTAQPDLVLSPVPRVKRLSADPTQWFGGGMPTDSTGRLAVSYYRIGPITPAYADVLTGPIQSGTGSGACTLASQLPTAGIGQGHAGSYTIVAKIIAQGATGAATFQHSIDGGSTYSGTQTTAASFTVPNIGFALQFGSGTFDVGDTYTFTAQCGGYLESQLMPAPTSNAQRAVVLMTGPDLQSGGELFEIVPPQDIVVDRPSGPVFRQFLYVRRIAAAP